MPARLLSLAFLLIFSSAAQIQQLSTTQDGSQLYFASSLSPKGSNLPTQGKIYKATSAGVELWAYRTQVGPTIPPSTPDNIYYAVAGNYYDLSAPQVSSDGSVVLFAGRRGCITDYTSGCYGVHTSQTTVVGVPGFPELDFDGVAALNRNGRFAFIYALHISGPAPYDTANPTVLDLSAGGSQFASDQETFYSGVGVGATPLADDGTATFCCPRGDTENECSVLRVFVLRPNSAQQTSVIGGAPVIDAGAKVVVYEAGATFPNDLRTLHVFTLATGTDRALFSTPASYGASISDDASRVLFVSTASGLPQVYVVNIDGTGLRQLTNDPVGVTEATLSGNGQVAWYATSAGQLFRLDVGSGQSQEVIPRTPALVTNQVYPFPTAGSVLTLTGANFTDACVTASAPFPTQLAGIQVKLAGIPVPLLSVCPTQVQFQMALDLPPTRTSTEIQLPLEVSSSSPLASVLTVTVYRPKEQRP